MYDPARDAYTLTDESSPVARSAKPTAAANGPDSQEEPANIRNNSDPPGQQLQRRRGRSTPPSTDILRQVLSGPVHVTAPLSASSAPQETAEGGSRQNGSLTSLRSAPDPSSSHSPSSRRHTAATMASPTGIHNLSHNRGSVDGLSASAGADHSKPQHPETDQQDTNTSPNEKKRKLPDSQSQPEDPKPAASEQPLSKRKRQEERFQKRRKRGKTPPSAYSRRDRSPEPSRSDARRSQSPRRRSPDGRRRDPFSRRSRSPSPIRRSPSPDPAVRQRKRPGGGARIASANVEAMRRRQAERERQLEEEAQKSLRDRGVHDVVRQHYNAVPERGREWRKTESRIKGLRSFNNWVKSALIQKFSPDEEFLARSGKQWADGNPAEDKKLLVIDLGCGKGGDLMKWQQAPQPVDLYVGLDPAEISVDQARERYTTMLNQRGRSRRGHLFHAEFGSKDCFGEWLGDVPIVQQVGIDGSVGPEGSLMSSRWGGGGFDVVVCMFTMHYAFETEQKARQMLHNVAGLLKKGGRFLGVGPNSDVLSAQVVEFHEKRKAREAAAAAAKQENGEKEEGEVEDAPPEVPEWGNSIYRVRFPGETPEDGIFRPAFGWKYSYFMEEAVEEIPEYVVPWEAFRALTQDYNLELQYRKPFLDIWKEEQNDPTLGPLSERMGVRERGGGPITVTPEELEAASFYHAFCFYKV
ncbi:hypothetical protein AJ80_05978 [Polytolypa hystricis UAMH7299]|uniref:mRNA cap guanine-N(7) methyltransferase n=1 Tax=Polytolypa hystricis (strain UAMH7299) TaxID=1447883 RepID=A0A2B7XZ94_POLH7|nr:hypothetical protein AJ80_05978 [Polytolypa hystricis UAMH7299]